MRHHSPSGYLSRSAAMVHLTPSFRRHCFGGTAVKHLVGPAGARVYVPFRPAQKGPGLRTRLRPGQT